MKYEYQSEVLKQCFKDVNAASRANSVNASKANIIPASIVMPGTEAEQLQQAFDILAKMKRGQALALPEKTPSLVGSLHTFFSRESKNQNTPVDTKTPRPK